MTSDKEAVMVRPAGRLLLVDAGQVDWVEAADNDAVLHVGTPTHLVACFG